MSEVNAELFVFTPAPKAAKPNEYTPIVASAIKAGVPAGSPKGTLPAFAVSVPADKIDSTKLRVQRAAIQNEASAREKSELRFDNGDGTIRLVFTIGAKRKSSTEEATEEVAEEATEEAPAKSRK